MYTEQIWLGSLYFWSCKSASPIENGAVELCPRQS